MAAAAAAVPPAGLVASQREAARRLGVSHRALQRAAQAGRIAPEPGGGWDLEKVCARLPDERADAAHGRDHPAALRIADCRG